MRREATKELRTGYSTGACAAAVISAAYTSLINSGSPLSLSHSVLFPDETCHEMKLLERKSGFAEIIKDAGDDPDCTNGAHIYASIEAVNEIDEYSKAYVLQIDKATLVLDAIEGIGLCTRKGLPCEKGKWAINPGPLQMIEENLRSCGFGRTTGIWRAALGVRGGEALAGKTLNSRLGIIGGLSILGTTGYVKPYSHEAYEDSIKMQVQSLIQQGESEVLFATGSSTSRGALEQLTHLTDESLVLIGDFVAAALKSAENMGITKVFLACMPGKLCKYCSGYTNTHAHKTDMQLRFVEDVVREMYPSRCRDFSSVPTVREALVGFTKNEQRLILRELLPLALENLQRFAPSLDIEILLFHFDGTLIGTIKE